MGFFLGSVLSVGIASRGQRTRESHKSCKLRGTTFGPFLLAKSGDRLGVAGGSIRKLGGDELKAHFVCSDCRQSNPLSGVTNPDSHSGATVLLGPARGQNHGRSIPVGELNSSTADLLGTSVKSILESRRRRYSPCHGPKSLRLGPDRNLGY